MSEPALIETSELWFSYGDAPVLRGLSCAIRRKLLTRVLRPQRGELQLEGRDYGRLTTRQLARRIAVVPQESPVLFPFTVAEVVLMGRAPYIGSFAFERHEDLEVARRAMEQTDVADLADRLMGELSGGEKQRVIVARALAQQPEILMLDEPTSSLDIKHQIGVYELLATLNRERGLTVLTVSHDLNMAAQYCRRLVLLRRGRVHQSGTPLEVISAENIREVYGAEVAVERRGQPPTPFVLPRRNLACGIDRGAVRRPNTS